MSSPEIPPDLLEQAERALGGEGRAMDWFFKPNDNLGGYPGSVGGRRVTW
jgi:hypothetical protein